MARAAGKGALAAPEAASSGMLQFIRGDFALHPAPRSTTHNSSPRRSTATPGGQRLPGVESAVTDAGGGAW